MCSLWCKWNLISIISRVSATAWQRASGIRRRRWRRWLAYPIIIIIICFIRNKCRQRKNIMMLMRCVRKFVSSQIRCVHCVRCVGWKPRFRFRHQREPSLTTAAPMNPAQPQYRGSIWRLNLSHVRMAGLEGAVNIRVNSAQKQILTAHKMAV